METKTVTAPREWDISRLVVEGKLHYSSKLLDRRDFSDAVVARFEAKVDRSAGPDACHLWTARTRPAGYGAFNVARTRTLAAHRVAYAIRHGFAPGALVLRHTCDNPPCCNPAHLLPGTTADNNRDRDERGRSALGEAHGNAKLTASAVRDMRRRAAGGASYVDLAVEYGVADVQVHNAVTGKTWAHVEVPPVTDVRTLKREWRADEDEFLRRTFDVPLKIVAASLGRNVNSVTWRRVHLRRAAGIAPAPRRGAWTPEDDVVILATLDDPVTVPAERLGRSPSSVYTRRYTLRKRQGGVAA